MSKAFKLIVAVFFPLFGFAQNSDSARWKGFKNMYSNPYKSFEACQIAGIRTQSELSTIGVSNKFICPFLFKKRLEKETIDKTIEREGNKSLSFEANNEMGFVNLKSHLFHNKSINWYVKAGTHQRSYTRVSNDAMRLMFKGNTESSPYSFDNNSYYNLRLSKIGGGLYYHNEMNPKPYNLSFGVSVLQGLNYGRIKTYERNYYQGNEDSFKIGVNYDAEFAGTKAFSGNGIGIGFEFMFNQKLSEKSTWGIAFENMGAVKFNNKLTSYSAYGEYSFDGLFISDLSRLKEENYIKHKLDSFTNPITNKKEGESKMVLIAPISFLYYNVHLSSGYYQIGLRHNGTIANPVAELRYFNFISPNILFGASLGTIGAWYLNTDVNWSVKDHLFIQAGVFHLEALALPNNLGGIGGNFGVQYVF